MAKNLITIALLFIAMSLYAIQANAVPVNDPIELAVDFEPDQIGCDRYEQFVELPKNNTKEAENGVYQVEQSARSAVNITKTV